MQWKQDRDAIVALLAIGAAMADPELAKRLNLDGIPVKQKLLSDVAAAVKELQVKPAVDPTELNHSKSVIETFFARLGIVRSTRLRAVSQIINAANEYALAARARKWALGYFTGSSMLPKGTRAEVIDILKKHGFTDGE